MNIPTPQDRGHWMQTFTGRAFYPLAPVVGDIDIADIAHSLAFQCRYHGHTARFYSVAEHSVLLSRNVSQANALWALLHDAAEAYVGDMVRPLKVSMPDFCAAEDRILDAIALKYGLPSGRIPDEVREADTRILLDERDTLLGAPPKDWNLRAPGGPLGVTIECWEPELAERIFLARFAQLVVTR